jgi:hypothetical protein
MSRPKTRGRPFPKGKSGNPGGRPVNSDCLSACLREVAAESAGAGLSHAQKLARVMFKRAEAGDMRAAALIADRLEGKPGQKVEVTTPQPLSFAEAAARMHGPIYSGVIPPSQAGKPEKSGGSQA